MIVLGPMDADLGGAPPYWRRLGWRPPGPDPDAAIRAIATVPTIPFDRCDVVLAYDATDAKRPLPGDQGWDIKASGAGPVHDADQGTLTIDAPAGEELWFLASTPSPARDLPDHAVLWALFAVEGARGDIRPGEGPDERPIGFDMQVLANRADEPARGMRASWGSRFVWRSLGRGDRVKRIDASVPHDTLLAVWHTVAIDGRLTGFETRRDEVPPGNDIPLPDDGGRTLGSLDGLVDNDGRLFFGTAPDASGAANFAARFGKTDPEGDCRARVRRFVASAPGRWLAAEFRAAAPGKGVRLRLVLYADGADDGAEGAAVFLIRYASDTEVRPNQRATAEVTISRQFDATSVHRVVEAAVDLRPFRPGAPLWFSIERDWRSETDTLRATVHLLQVVLEAP